MLPGTNHPECRLLLLQDKLARINALTRRAPPRALFLFVPLLVEQPARRFRRPEVPASTWSARVSSAAGPPARTRSATRSDAARAMR